MKRQVAAGLWGASTLLTFGLVILGGFVTSTDSGFGCGANWPDCGGRWLPPGTFHGDVEWSHRVLAGLVSVLVLAAVYMTVRYSRNRWARRFSWLAVILLLGQVALGAAIVLNGIPAVVVAVHDGVATAFLATLLVQTLLAARTGEALLQTSGAPILWVAAGLSWLTVMVGSYLAHLDLQVPGLWAGVRALGTADGRYVGFWHWFLAALVIGIGVAAVRSRQYLASGAAPFMVAGFLTVVAQAVLGLLLIATHLSELVLAIHESVGVAAVVLLTAAAVRATARMPDVGERPAIDVSP